VTSQDPCVTAFDYQFVDGYQLELLGSMMKFDAFESASGRKVGWVIAANGDGAIARFREIFLNLFFGERPVLGGEDGGYTSDGHHKTAENNRKFAKSYR
jgi:hypothetical protein